MNTKLPINAKHLLLIILIAVPFALFMNLHNSNVVTVRADYPKEVIAGTSFTVTITIDKGNLSGFGRYTHTLPDGLKAESSSQNFEFSDNTVKFLWINIPYANSFTFSYTIYVPVDYKQSITVNGKFGYVVDNERRFAEIIPNQIKVINDPLALRKYQAEQQSKSAPVNIDDVTCYRSVNVIGNEAIVSLRVNKANVNSMCKIEEMLPQGYVFYAIDRENADFSSHNNIARFMWLDAPQKDIFYVSYKVIPNPGYSISNLFINGAFSFVDNGITQTVVILERDMRAVSESTGKPLETSLDPNYNANLQSGLSKTTQVQSTPSTTNYSSRAPYDISSQNINSDLSSNQPSLQSKSNPTNTQVQSIGKPVDVPSTLPESNEELATNLKSKNYSQNQIDFFTSSNIAAKPQPYPGTYSPAEDIQGNLQSQQQSIPNPNNKPTVNINAIPAPTTYFPSTQQYSIDDPDNVSTVTNPSYNKNMESGGVNTPVQQSAPAQNQTPQNTSQAVAQSKTTNAEAFENTLYIPAPNLQQQNEQAVKQQTIEEVAKTTPNITTLPNGNKPGETVQYQNQTQPRVSTPGSVQTTSQYSVNQQQSNSTQNTSSQTSSEKQTTSQATSLSTKQPYQQQTVAQGTTTRVPTQTVTGTTPTTQQVQVQNGSVTTKPTDQTTTQSAQPTSNGVTPQSYQQQTVAQGTTTRVPTQTVTGTTPTTQQVQVQNGGITTKPTGQTTTQSVQPTSNGVTPQTYQQQTVAQGTTTRIPTQTITGTTPTTQQVQVQNGGITTKPTGQTTTQSVQPTSNGVTPQTYQQQTVAQGTTTRVPTQTITGSAPTTQQVQNGGVTTSKPITQNTLPTQTAINNRNTQNIHQGIIQDENHNNLAIENTTTQPRLSNKENYSQNETKITQISEPNRKLNVYFRVQISAGRRLVNTKFYFAKLNIRDNIIVEQIEGWFKYTINKFDTYVTARNQRNTLWNDSPIKDAFVVAYNGRNRITVQEALMITNQKWVQ